MPSPHLGRIFSHVAPRKCLGYQMDGPILVLLTIFSLSFLFLLR